MFDLGFKIQARDRKFLVMCLVVLLIASWAGLSSCYAADEREWELSHYRVMIHLAVDTTVRPQSGLKEKIAQHLQQRIYATIYPLVSVEFSQDDGAVRNTLVHHMDRLDQETSDETFSGFDKEMYLAIVATNEGFHISCREVDRFTSIWSPVLSRQIRQARMVPEQCFYLLQETFAPLAKVRKVADDDSHVLLLFKGSSLPRRTDEATFAGIGTVYQSLKIRTSRRGEKRPDSISQVPWTYLTLEGLDDHVGHCLMHSGIRHPFGVRRRGRVEHVAIALRQSTQATRVRFYARHDKTQSLVGYEVFQRTAEDQPSQPMGLTDAHGSVLVPPEKQGVTTLLLRSDGKLLAKVPIAAGALEKVEVPIADDTARLEAQATLTSLREQLIDLVARRNILISRVRDRLENDKPDEARELLSQLDALPGRAHFAQLLSTAERNGRNRSSEPLVQKRIEKMFADTRKLLGRFLSTRQLTELQSELNASQQGDTS